MMWWQNHKSITILVLVGPLMKGWFHIKVKVNFVVYDPSCYTYEFSLLEDYKENDDESKIYNLVIEFMRELN